MPSHRVVVVIPVKDEEVHLRRCLESVGGAWPVVVVDGGSSDGTVAIARECGVTVLERAWTGYAEQKNWALAHLPIESDWVLFLDADEQLTPALRDEIEDVVRTDAAAFAIPRRYVFLGKELRHAWWYPDYQIRLFRRGRARFEERLVHEHPVVDGVIRPLEQALIHDNQKGLTAFLERHMRYAGLEAQERMRPSDGRQRGAFIGSKAERRRALKERVWYRLPLRPLVRFWWLYIVKGGCLDGWRGLLFCRLIAHYEFLIDVKTLELRLGGGT